MIDRGRGRLAIDEGPQRRHADKGGCRGRIFVGVDADVGKTPIGVRRSMVWTRLVSTRQVRLFADAETSEYFAQQVIRREFAGDRSERQLGQTQLFSEEFELGKLGASGGKVLAGR